MNIIPLTLNINNLYPVGENIHGALEYINVVTPFIKDLIGDKPINIWCSGSSGAILSAFLVKNLNNPCIICHVKKEGEHSHHGNSFSKIYKNDCINIILDDFMSSGTTIERIYKQAKYNTLQIDILILANAYKGPWFLPFKPINFIIDKDAIHDSW